MLANLFRFSYGAVIACLAGIWFQASAQSLKLISTVNPEIGPPAAGSGDSWAPLISPDTRYVLFASSANNLLMLSNNASMPGGFPAYLNVFLRDRINHTTSLISADQTGVAGGNGDSVPLGISTNGSFVLFQSQANNLVPGQVDTNTGLDIFMRDVFDGTTRLVSANTNGASGNKPSRDACMTPDGRFIAFVSEATDLVSDDTNGIADIFVRDMQRGTTTLVSVGAMSTTPAFRMGSSEAPAITPDGRYVVFYSTATNLVPGVHSAGEIYVRDLNAQTTTWVSSAARPMVLNLLGQSNAVSFNHAISADGKYVAYEASPVSSDTGIVLRYTLSTGSTELIYTNAAVPLAPAYHYIDSLVLTPNGRFVAFLANDNASSNRTTFVFLWDSNGGGLTLVSGDLAGQVPSNSTCAWPVIDDSGRYAAFLSTAPGLVTNEAPGLFHIYRRDVQSRTTSLIDSDTNGIGSSVSAATIPSLSADGRFVAFDGGDGNLVSGDKNRDSDAFVRDALNSATELISLHHPALGSSTPNGMSSAASGCVSYDGRFVVFASEANNLVAGDTNECADIFVRDMQSGIVTLASAATNGSFGNGWCWEPSISPDGRYVAFTSMADNLVSGDTNMAQDVFVRDMLAGTTRLVSVNANGTGSGNAASYSPRLSSDGHQVLFQSRATDLAAPLSTQGFWFHRNLQTSTTTAFPASAIVPAAMSDDGRLVFYWDLSSNRARVWNDQAGGLGTILTSLPYLTIYEASFSPDGGKLALGAVYSGLWVASTSNPQELPQLIYSNVQGSVSGIRWSGDGNKLVFRNANTVWLHDFASGANLVVSHTQNNPIIPADGVSDSAEIGVDGRFVVFRSTATNLVTTVPDSRPRVFLYDTQTGLNSLLIEATFDALPALGRPLRPFFSGNGKSLCLASWSESLVANDFNQNSDIFAFSLLYGSITTPNSPDQPVVISWPSAGGKKYKVQFRDGLEDEVWHDFSGAITTNSNTASIQDAAPNPQQRLYRIVSF